MLTRHRILIVASVDKRANEYGEKKFLYNKTSALAGGGKRMRHTSVDVVVRVCLTLNTDHYTPFFRKVNLAKGAAKNRADPQTKRRTRPKRNSTLRRGECQSPSNEPADLKTKNLYPKKFQIKDATVASAAPTFAHR